MTTLPFSGLPLPFATAATTDLARTISDLSVAITSTAVLLLMALVVAAVITRRRHPAYKGPLFTLIVLITTLTTVTLGGATLALNGSSPTAGPVRWGTDYQIWACGNQLDLRNPRGLMNDRIGTPTLYEKNDGRIYYDGTPTRLPDDATLGMFMTAMGGEISDNSLVLPLNDTSGFVGTPQNPGDLESFLTTNKHGVSARFINGQRCGSDQAAVQVFVYQFNPATKTYSQSKLDHNATYELSHSQASPPGDCVIIEFAPLKNRTNHLCASYGIRDYDRCTSYGVPADKIIRCDIREVGS